MAMEVKCRSCGSAVGPDEGLTCGPCRLNVRTPFHIPLPTLKEMQVERSEDPVRKPAAVFAVVTIGLTVLMTATWAVAHYLLH